MGVLEEIIKMRKRGMTDNDIVKNLQDQGISPKAINDALNQADIKKAVSEQGQESREDDFVPPEDYHEGYGKTQDVSQAEGSGEYYPQPQDQEYADYGSGQQQGYDYSGQSAGLDTSTIIEISEQVFLEKIQKMQKKVDEAYEFKTLSESKIESILERLKKIESIIDKLQFSVLEKVGSYGENLEGIRKEMSMMQDSFGKLAGNVSDRREIGNVQQNMKVRVKNPRKKDNEDVFSSLKKISRKK